MTEVEGLGDLPRLIRFEAVRLQGHLPTGSNLDDLESVGNEAVCEALARGDRTNPIAFRKFIRITVRSRMKDFLKAARKRRVKEAGVPRDRESGVTVETMDRSASDPADVAAAREQIRLSGVTVALPSPVAVAVKVELLRSALWSAVSPEDVAAVVSAQVKKAKGGSTRAAEFVTRLLTPSSVGKSSSPQQAVFVNVQDVR